MPKKLVDQLDPNICKRVKKESTLSSTSGNAPTNRSANRPILNTDSFEVSIRDLLKHVNDNLNLPYINPDGTPNYGIYLGDHETGGVMFITPNKHKKNHRLVYGKWGAIPRVRVLPYR